MKFQKTAAIFLMLLIHASTSFCMEFDSAVSRGFSKNIIKKVTFKNGLGTMLFNFNDEYFGTGDKINKICAIDSARLFMYVPELNGLKIAIPLQRNTKSYRRGIYTLQITRSMPCEGI